jgi:hypothetical protein
MDWTSLKRALLERAWEDCCLIHCILCFRERVITPTKHQTPVPAVEIWKSQATASATRRFKELSKRPNIHSIPQRPSLVASIAADKADCSIASSLDQESIQFSEAPLFSNTRFLPLRRLKHIGPSSEFLRHTLTPIVSNHLALEMSEVHIPCLITTLHMNTYESESAGYRMGLAAGVAKAGTPPGPYLNGSLYPLKRDFAFPCCLV